MFRIISVANRSNTVRVNAGQRLWALFSLLGFATTVAIMGYLHLTSGPEYSPISRTISDYIFVNYGSELLSGTGLALAIGSAALLVGLARTKLLTGVPLVAFAVLWCGGLVLALVFPTDPVGAPQTISSTFHRLACEICYPSLPLAGFYMAWRCRFVTGWTRMSKTIFWLSIISAVALVVFTFTFLCSVSPEIMPYGYAVKGYIGLAERILFIVDLTWLSTFSVALWRNTGAMETTAGPQLMPAVRTDGIEQSVLEPGQV